MEKEICKIPWCEELISKNTNGQWSNLCIEHNSICTGGLRMAVRNGWFHKLYKWEKYLSGEDVVCERCSRNCKEEYPELPGSRFLMLYDVDHIKAKKNNEDNTEHPDNYQLLCKSCHGAKSILGKDYYNKKYDDYKKLERKNLLDLDLNEILSNISVRKEKLVKIKK
jgi:5-methylcytosine-specific restriction endonuclease McrA|tara:strand:+ start:140 stop:640 length:501 start_codon:yes stop_codon:yes gene_type:complete